MIKKKYLILIIILTIITIFNFILVINNRDKKEIIYGYSVNKQIDYNVKLLPNNFYENNILQSNLYYASKSIDTININFKYNFKGSEIINLNYRYKIIAKIESKSENDFYDDVEVWNREYNLLEKQKESYSDKFFVDENIDIDYNYYNNLVEEYESEYGIFTKSVLKIYLIINCKINLPELKNNDANFEDVMELEIPLTKTVTNVNKNLGDDFSKSLFVQKELVNINIIISVISIILLIEIGVLIWITINNLKYVMTPDKIYKRKIKRILKNYKDIIVTVSNYPDIKNLKNINLLDFDDLIDLSEQNEKTIIHYEVKKDEDNLFFIIIDNYCYRFNYNKKTVL